MSEQIIIEESNSGNEAPSERAGMFAGFGHLREYDHLFTWFWFS